MKIRYGFVSNSSSSSFTLTEFHLTPLQKVLIKNHIEIAKLIEKEYPGTFDNCLVDDAYEWKVIQKDGKFIISTTMDNFDMTEFLEVIGVPSKLIKFDHNY